MNAVQVRVHQARVAAWTRFLQDVGIETRGIRTDYLSPKPHYVLHCSVLTYLPIPDLKHWWWIECEGKRTISSPWSDRVVSHAKRAIWML